MTPASDNVSLYDMSLCKTPANETHQNQGRFCSVPNMAEMDLANVAH